MNEQETVATLPGSDTTPAAAPPRRRLVERARHVMVEVLPEAPAVRVTRAGVGLSVLAVVAATVVSLLRQPGPGALDTVWAEDGTIFLSGAVNQGFVGALTTSYNGYFHLVPRLLAEIASVFPAPAAAAVLAISAALVTSLLALLVYVATAPHIASRLSRLLVSAVVVLLPVAQDEIPNSIANLHWAGLYTVFWLLLWVPKGRWARGVSAAVILLVAASDVLTIVFLPLALARLWVRRDRQSGVLLGLLSLGVSAQVAGLLFGSSSRALHPALGSAAVRYVLRAVPAGVLGERWLGVDVDARWLAVAAVAWILVIVATLVAVRGVTRPDWPLFTVAGLHSIGLYALPVFLAGTATPRYAAAPAMLVLVCLVCLLRPREPGTSLVIDRRRARVPLQILAVLMLVVFAVNLREDNRRAAGPSWSGELDRVGATCHDPAATRDVQIPPGPMWQTRLPCRYLHP